MSFWRGYFLYSVYSQNVYYMYSLSLTKYCILFNTRRVYLLQISLIIIHTSSFPNPGKVVTLSRMSMSSFTQCALNYHGHLQDHLGAGQACLTLRTSPSDPQVTPRPSDPQVDVQALCPICTLIMCWLSDFRNALRNFETRDLCWSLKYLAPRIRGIRP